MATIIDALEHPDLLGALPEFRDLSSWASWLVFLKAVYGLPMSPEDLVTFRQATGRQAPRPGGYPEAAVIVGRQAGKSRLCATVAVFEAALHGAKGEHVLLIAQDSRGAQRGLLTYCKDTIAGVPVLAQEVARETADTLELRNGTCLSVYPCNPRAVRGIRARMVLVDELAFFLSTDGRPTDQEMLRAVRPCLATTGGKLLILSSPHGQSGALYNLHQRHYGRDDSPTLVWQASAPDMNPTLAVDYLERMREEDPEAYRSEVMGEFRAGISSLFDSEALDAVVDHGRRESPPVPGIKYLAHFDASSGRADSSVVALGHREGPRIRVDLVRSWRPPFNPEVSIEEAAAILKTYGCYRVQIDRFSAPFVQQAFSRHGIRAEVARATTSDHHLALLPVVNAGLVVLPDVPELLRELRGLERRTGGGRDRVDHRSGAHDDAAAALSGVVALLAQKGRRDCGISIGGLKEWRQARDARREAEQEPEEFDSIPVPTDGEDEEEAA